MKDAIEEAGSAVAHELERFLTTLGTIATISPLMGLFGTVVGMIEIFNSQSPTGSNPRSWPTVFPSRCTTRAFGLVIAIPAMIFFRHFRGRVEGFVVEMEQQAAKLVDVSTETSFRIPAATAYSGMSLPARRRKIRKINLIPMIDVLLVIIIFLMLTTTYSRFAELKDQSAERDAERKPERANEINVVISANGQYVLQRKPVQFRDVASLAEELRRAGTGMKDAIVVVNADNNANYQSVIRVMDAARQAGYGKWCLRWSRRRS